MSSHDVERIKERLSIVDVLANYIKLEKAGINFKAKCPFHNEKTPSFFVSPVRNSYYCFGCGAKGDIFSFVQAFEGVDFVGALKSLAARAGITLTAENQDAKKEQDRRYAALDAAVKYFETQLAAQKEARAYVAKRGFTEETVKAWRIGFAPDAWREARSALRALHFTDAELVEVGLIRQADKGKEPYDWFRSRIMFPLFDVAGRPVAFSGRLFGQEERAGAPKYLNSPETPIFSKSHLLYGFHAAKNAIRTRGYSILVEGQVDLVLSHQAGFTNTVATSGTALTIDQLTQLKRLSPNIIMAYDADEAGARAAVRSTQLALSLSMDVKVARLPDGMDPADAVAKDPTIWAKALKEAVPLIAFYTDLICSSVRDPRKRDKEIVARVLPFVAALQSATERSRAIADIAYKTNQREEALFEDMKRIDPSVVLGTSDPNLPERTLAERLPAKDESVYRHMAAIRSYLGDHKDTEVSLDALDRALSQIAGALEKVRLFEKEGDMVRFEIERLYGEKTIPKADIIDLLHTIQKESSKQAYEEARRALREAERNGDHTKAATLLARCDALQKEMKSQSPPTLPS